MAKTGQINRRLDLLALSARRARELEIAELNAQLVQVWLGFTDSELEALELAASHYIAGGDLQPEQRALFDRLNERAGDLLTRLNELEDMRALCEIAGVDYGAYMASLSGNDSSPSA